MQLVQCCTHCNDLRVRRRCGVRDGARADPGRVRRRAKPGTAGHDLRRGVGEGRARLRGARRDAPAPDDRRARLARPGEHRLRLRRRPRAPLRAVPRDVRPGARPAGLRVVPDLAEGLGRASDGGRTWTYRLRPGVTYENGKPVRARDVKYAVARSGYTAQLTDGPRDLREALTGTYWGPYLDKDLDHFTGVTTPDDRTVVFHLKKPSADFDRLAASPQTAPVPRGRRHAPATTNGTRSPPARTSSSSTPSAPSFTLVRNPHWQDDPIRDGAARPDRGHRADPRRRRRRPAARRHRRRRPDRRRASSAAARDRILASPDAEGARRRPADRPGAVRDAAHRREALRRRPLPPRRPVRRRPQGRPGRLRQARPGETPPPRVLPPTLKGDRQSGGYPRDLARARAELRACGHPDGFATGLAVRADHPRRHRRRRRAEPLPRAGGDPPRPYGGCRRTSGGAPPARPRTYATTASASSSTRRPRTSRPRTGSSPPSPAPAAKVNDRNVMQLHDAGVDRDPAPRG